MLVDRHWVEKMYESDHLVSLDVLLDFADDLVVDIYKDLNLYK